MLNLIKKDLFLQRMSFIFYPILILIYIFSGLHPYFIVVFIGLVFLATAFYSDQKDKAQLLFLSLPYTRKEIVSARYLVVLFFPLPLIIIYLIGHHVMNRTDYSFDFSMMAVSYLIILITSALVMPLIYKFNFQTVIIMAVILIIGGFGVLEFMNGEQVDYIFEALSNFYHLIAEGFKSFMIPVGILLYLLSWILSIKIYQSKEF
ncbi:ABC transporter permease protein [Bacillus sp. TS-2]|nr:ABC transporter permease protein [Bacillus sp. TS-2]